MPMDNKMRFGIGTAIFIGISPAIIALYFNTSTNYIGLPGCEMIATREHCLKRNDYIHIPSYLLRNSAEAVLCALGKITGRFGQILENTMCRY